MTNEFILSHIDHTLLTPIAHWDDIKRTCEEAIKYKTASICIPPCWVSRIRSTFKDLNICTVIGFPFGYQDTKTKIYEIKQALKDGADEFDLVINLSQVTSKQFNQVFTELKEARQVVGNKILKVIIEAYYFIEIEKVKLCEIVTLAGADYIKTSTGYAGGGATIKDIMLFKEHIGPNVKIKAAGGLKDRGDMIYFLEFGCSRLGTSSGVKILTGNGGNENGY
jgi:deoxyribose-phosphate aldolase